MESPGYFVAVFVFAFLVAALLAEAPLLIGSIAGAAVFMLVKSAWYYVAYLTYNPAISSCILPPTYNCTVKGLPATIYFHFGGYPVNAATFFEGAVHVLLFFVFFLVWKLVLSD